jgi:2-methylisocitrate lyase-like PEP mutase family enzyme
VNVSSQRAKAEAFRSLHGQRTILLLPNVWDVGSARIFVKSGARAVGTTSAGIAASLGYGDGEEISREEMLDAVARIARSVDVPVTADIEGGYGESAEAAAETTSAAIKAGVVGVNIEDASPNADGREANDPLLPATAHAARIAAARKAAEDLDVPIVVNAVTHTYLKLPEGASRFQDTVYRARLYREAGADCVYVPRLKDRDEIAEFVAAVECPVNVLAMAGLPPTSELESLGVARLSFGFAATRAVISLLQRIAVEFLTTGTYNTLLEGALSNEAAEALVRQ